MHSLCDRVLRKNPRLRLAISAHIMRDITAGTEHDFHAIAKPCSGKDLGHHVVPERPGARKQNRLLLESVLACQTSRHLHGPVEKGADSSFLVKNPLVNLHAAEDDASAPPRKR